MEYRIVVVGEVLGDVNEKLYINEIDRIADVAFNAARNADVFMTSLSPVHKVHVFGKFSDYSRVFSALKNNRFKVVSGSAIPGAIDKLKSLGNEHIDEIVKFLER